MQSTETQPTQPTDLLAAARDALALADARGAPAKKALGAAFWRRFEARLRAAEKGPEPTSRKPSGVEVVLRRALEGLHKDLGRTDEGVRRAFGVGDPLGSPAELVDAAARAETAFSDASTRVKVARAGVAEPRVRALLKLRDEALAGASAGLDAARVAAQLAEDTARITQTLADLPPPKASAEAKPKPAPAKPTPPKAKKPAAPPKPRGTAAAKGRSSRGRRRS